MEYFEWGERAACRVFPAYWWDGDLDWRVFTDQAKRICRRCPVRQQCDDEGKRQTAGIWAGVDRTPPRSRSEQRREGRR